MSFVLRTKSKSAKKDEPPKEPEPPKKVTLISKAQDHLGKIPIVLKLEKKFETDRLTLSSVFVLGMVYLLVMILNFKGRLWSELLLFYFPAYQSIKTIENADLQGYKQWLSYWIIFGFVELFENLRVVLKIFPYYFVLKSLVAIWLMKGGSVNVFDLVIKRWIPIMDQIAVKLLKFC